MKRNNITQEYLSRVASRLFRGQRTEVLVEPEWMRQWVSVLVEGIEVASGFGFSEARESMRKHMNRTRRPMLTAPYEFGDIIEEHEIKSGVARCISKFEESAEQLCEGHPIRTFQPYRNAEEYPPAWDDYLLPHWRPHWRPCTTT